jgi:hypothetical protein
VAQAVKAAQERRRQAETAARAEAERREVEAIAAAGRAYKNFGV